MLSRYLRDIANKKYELKHNKVELVFKFFSLFNQGTNNQFILQPYQIFDIVNLFGIYHKGTNRRKHQSAFLFIGKKNGKTTFSAILQLYFLMADGAEFPKSILVASDKTQAGIALEQAINLISVSPAIKKYVESKGPRDLRSTLVWRDNRPGWIKVFASDDPDKLDGQIPTSAILDEVHTYKDYKIYNMVKDGMSSATNPMLLLTSTAGYLEKGLCQDLVDLGKRVLDPAIDYDNETFYFSLHMLDEGDNPNDEKVWIKANPTLGIIKSFDFLRSAYREAKSLPSRWPSFLVKHLNIFQSANGEYIPTSFIKAVSSKIDRTELLGRTCNVGMDLSSVGDLAALSFTFFFDGKYRSFTQFFMGNKQENTIRKGGLDLTPWVDAGYILKCESPSLDYEYVYEYIMQQKALYNIESIYYDPINTPLLNSKLEKEGFNLVSFKQTTMNFNGPIKELEKAIYDENIILDENPVLIWNFKNIVLWRDTNHNFKFLKNKDKDSIDGCVSLAESMKGWIEEKPNSDIEAASKMWQSYSDIYNK
jgi:phage terminase large subunit-like protein